MTEREMVEEFHEAMGVPVRTTPTMPSEDERLRGAMLLLEEAQEYARACGFTVYHNGRPFPDQYRLALLTTHAPDLAAMAHELADVHYIAHGRGLEMGAPPEVFSEVHRANMSKLGDDGKPVLREDGKVMKGPNYRPPDVAGVLARASLNARRTCLACRMPTVTREHSCGQVVP